MTDINILQRQFEAAAQKYPGLQHTIVQRSKEGCDPVFPSPWNDENLVYWWGPDFPREANEKGYPSWHYLSRSCLQKWDVGAAYDVCCSLTEEAGKLLIDLPELKGLWVERKDEYWLLALHRIYPDTKWTTVAFKRGEKILTGDTNPEHRPAKTGESYYETLGSVFLKSALLCEKLFKIVKELPKELQREPMTLKIFIEIALGINRASNKNLRGELSKYKSTREIEYPHEIGIAKSGQSKRYNPEDLYLYYKKWRQDIPTLPKLKTFN